MEKKRIYRCLIWMLCLMLFCGMGVLPAGAEKASPTVGIAFYNGNGEPVESITYGDVLVLTATLTGADSPEGDVVFYMDGDPIGRVQPDAAGVATLTVTGKPLTATSHDISAEFEGDERNNGTVTYEAAEIAVAKKDLTVTGVAVADKEYDGNTDAIVTDLGTLSGALEGDDVSLALTSARFVSSEVAENVEVNVTVRLAGEDKGNYRIKQQPAGLTADILDLTDPTGDILASGDSMIDDGVFDRPSYRGSVTVTFACADWQSGVAEAVYQIVSVGAEPTEEAYLPLPADHLLVIDERGGYQIFFRVRDKSGNEIVLHTREFVVFNDAVAQDTAASYTFYDNTPATVAVQPNGNTVSGLLLDGTALPETAFSVSEEGILTLFADFLETLAAGEHTVTVQYLPVKYPYVSGDMPAPTQFILTLLRKDPAATDFRAVLPQDAVYDGEGKAAEIDPLGGMGTVTVVYVDQNGTQRTAPPAEAGSYKVWVSVLTGEKFYAAESLLLGEFVIGKANVTRPIGVTVSGCTTLANNDGMVTGLPAGVEYRPGTDPDGAWIAVEGSELLNLTPGEYEVRYAEDENHFAGVGYPLTVEAYEGIPEIAPAVTYDTATGVLSGERLGDLYRIDGGEWTGFSGNWNEIFDRPMTVEFYHPGDGVYTLDSEIVEMHITRAATPEPAVRAETLFARCNGMILCVNQTMEYRRVGESNFLPITGDRVTDLAPGIYEVRVRAAGTALASETAMVIVPAAPEFVEKTAEAGEGVSLPAVRFVGSMTADATLSLVALSTEGNSAILDRVDLRTTEVLAYFDAVFCGRTEDPARVYVTLGNAFEDGRELTLYLEVDGVVSQQTATVQNGMISFEANGSVKVLIAEPMTTPHGRGSAAWIIVLAVFLTAAVAVCVIMEIKTTRTR